MVGWDRVFSTRAKWRFCLKRMPNYALDNADIVREAMLRQLSSPSSAKGELIH